MSKEDLTREGVLQAISDTTGQLADDVNTLQGILGRGAGANSDSLIAEYFQMAQGLCAEMKEKVSRLNQALWHI